MFWIRDFSAYSDICKAKPFILHFWEHYLLFVAYISYKIKKASLLPVCILWGSDLLKCFFLPFVSSDLNA